MATDLYLCESITFQTHLQSREQVRRGGLSSRAKRNAPCGFLIKINFNICVHTHTHPYINLNSCNIWRKWYVFSESLYSTCPGESLGAMPVWNSIQPGGRWWKKKLTKKKKLQRCSSLVESLSLSVSFRWTGIKQTSSSIFLINSKLKFCACGLYEIKDINTDMMHVSWTSAPSEKNVQDCSIKMHRTLWNNLAQTDEYFQPGNFTDSAKGKKETSPFPSAPRYLVLFLPAVTGLHRR